MIDKRILLASKLNTLDPTTKKILIGFDGFVDEIIHVVDKRQDSTTYTRLDRIDALANRVKKAAGLSTNIELVPIDKKIGGNGPIMCNALSKHNGEITYLGALGYPIIDEVFRGLEDNVTPYSFANPGHTDALEFFDGKLMLGKMTTLDDVTYENLVSAIGFNKLTSLLGSTDLFATVNWSMLPHMTSLWKSLLTNVIPTLPKRKNKSYFFVDLADPEKREPSEIKEALDILKEFKDYFFVVLGLNKKEAFDIANVLGLFDASSLKNMQVSLQALTQALYDYLQIDCIVIHPVDRSCTMVDGTFYEASGPYIAKPKLTTGAGDNFNAGFMLGLLLGLTPEQALLTGMTTSGFYVRQAHSPTYNELIAFMKEWASGTL